MKTALVLLAVLASAPVLADATITGVRTRLDETHAEILVLSPDTLPAPRFRNERGGIRVWFADVDQERLTERGDGLAIRDVRVRSGAGDTALVHVRWGDRRRIGEEAVTLTAFEGGYAVRIARAALPRPPEAAPVEANEEQPVPAEAESPEPETNATAGASAIDGVTTLEEGAVADEESATEPDALTDGAVEELADDAADQETAAVATPIAATPLALSTTSPVGETPLPYGLILLITLLLAGLHFVVRFVAKKRNTAPAPEISVVATKRVGPRHQLLVVRALGEEHLLSVNAGQTQIITSVTQTGQHMALAPTMAMPASEPRSKAPKPGAELARKLGLPASALPAASEALSPDERFGARLLALATARRDERQDSSPAPVSQAASLEHAPRVPRAPTLSGISPDTAALRDNPVAGLMALRQGR